MERKSSNVLLVYLCLIFFALKIAECQQTFLPFPRDDSTCSMHRLNEIERKLETHQHYLDEIVKTHSNILETLQNLQTTDKREVIGKEMEDKPIDTIYYAAFPRIFQGSKSGKDGLTLTANNDTFVEISSLWDSTGNKLFHSSKGKAVTLEFLGNNRLYGNEVENKAVKINASGTDPLLVLVETGSLDIYKALPSNKLGKKYIIPSYTISDDETNEVYHFCYILIIGIVDGTEVTITLPNNQGKKEIKLNEFQTYQYQKRNGDLSGTEVISTEIINVISGCDCASVPSNTLYQTCDALVVQVPAIDTWGHPNSNFPVAPIAGNQNGYIVRIFAANDDTNIKVTVSEVSTHTIHSNGFWEYRVATSSPCFVECSKECMVVQLNVDSGSTSPFMMVIPPTSHYLKKDISLSTAHRSEANDIYLSNHLTIVKEKDTGIKVDKESLEMWQRIPGTPFYYGSIPLVYGIHNITSESSASEGPQYVAFVNGYNDESSYGYSLP